MTTVAPPSCLSGDLLILLLAMGLTLLAVCLTQLTSPSDAPTDASPSYSAGHVVTLVTPLHRRDTTWPDPVGLTLADNAHTHAIPAASTPTPEVATQAAALPTAADLTTLGPHISVVTDAHALRFRIASDTLFATAQANLTPAGRATLQPLVAILQRHNAPVAIEGHADSIPIHNQRHPSNWEFSASRAVSVLRYLADHGIAAERLHASAYAHTRALADNATAEGRASNRRIEIVVALPQPQSSLQRSPYPADMPSF